MDFSTWGYNPSLVPSLNGQANQEVCLGGLGRPFPPFVPPTAFSSSWVCPLCRLAARTTQTVTQARENPVTLPIRIGIGHDTHRLGPGGPLRLGGVDIPCDRSLLGHSDADLLLHALTDALLGAAALGDIGQLFPDTDPANKGRDSADMLLRAWQQVQSLGYQIINIDCIVFAQRPKLADYKDAIRHRIAGLLGLEVGQVGVKAKTGEKVGPVGREEALESQVVVLLEKINP